MQIVWTAPPKDKGKSPNTLNTPWLCGQHTVAAQSEHGCRLNAVPAAQGIDVHLQSASHRKRMELLARSDIHDMKRAFSPFVLSVRAAKVAMIISESLQREEAAIAQVVVCQ
jgi:hypothetical protein